MHLVHADTGLESWTRAKSCWSVLLRLEQFFSLQHLLTVSRMERNSEGRVSKKALYPWEAAGAARLQVVKHSQRQPLPAAL